MNKIIAFSVLLALLFFPVLSQNHGGRGQGNSGNNYDVSAEVTHTVTILEILMGQQRYEGQYRVQLEDGTQVGLVVGPPHVIATLGLQFETGDTFQVTGVFIAHPASKEIFVAGSIEKDGNVVLLRDEEGIPVWRNQNSRISAGNRSRNGRRGEGNTNQGVCMLRYLATTPKEELSQEELDALVHLRQEEKLARDVYLYLFDQHSAAIFTRIARAEQQHMDAIKVLMDRYGLEDPVGEDMPGSFSDSEFQELYQALIQEGENSLEAALLVGAKIEDLDIYDLKNALQVIDNTDIRMVFQNLMKGSRNHMRAFFRQLANLGVSYQAQFLTQEEVDAIINSDWERRVVYDADGQPLDISCNGGGGRRGHGRGQGRNRNQ